MLSIIQYMVSSATNLINITVQIMHSHHYQGHDDTDLTTLPSHCKEKLNYYLNTTALRYLTITIESYNNSYNEII